MRYRTNRAFRRRLAQVRYVASPGLSAGSNLQKGKMWEIGFAAILAWEEGVLKPMFSEEIERSHAKGKNIAVLFNDSNITSRST
jgi:hypothetical protein